VTLERASTRRFANCAAADPVRSRGQQRHGSIFGGTHRDARGRR
jgi:hypothetical protein